MSHASSSAPSFIVCWQVPCYGQHWQVFASEQLAIDEIKKWQKASPTTKYILSKIIGETTHN